MMTTTDVAARTTAAGGAIGGGRVGGWLMALSPLGYAALVAAMAGIFASTVGTNGFAEITREQMDALGGAWIAARAIVAVASAVVVAGAGLVAWTLRRSRPAARALAWATIALAVVNAVMLVLDVVNGVAAMGFTTVTLGEDPAFRLSDELLPWTFGAVILELLLLCIALWASGARRRTGLVMSVVAFVVLVVTVFAAASVPPFVTSLLACPVGISWLAGSRSARRGSLS